MMRAIFMLFLAALFSGCAATDAGHAGLRPLGPGLETFAVGSIHGPLTQVAVAGVRDVKRTVETTVAARLEELGYSEVATDAAADFTVAALFRVTTPPGSSPVMPYRLSDGPGAVFSQEEVSVRLTAFAADGDAVLWSGEGAYRFPARRGGLFDVEQAVKSALAAFPPADEPGKIR